MVEEAWFDEVDGAVVPRPHANAPWSEDMLHGRLLAGLAARAVETGHLDDGWHPARLTIDLFRSPPMAAIALTSTRVRDGGRVRVVDVTMAAGGRDIAGARVLLVKRSDADIGDVWSRPAWTFPHPDVLSPPEGWGGEDSIWQFRTQPGEGMGAMGAKRMWLRDAAALVAGEALTPFVRVAMVADFASPLGNSGPDGLDVINPDITLYLARLPTSDWIGFEVLTHEHADGVAAASCAVHDLDGAIGTSTVAAITY